MTKVRIIPASVCHLRELAKNLRPGDRDELRLTGRSASAALMACFRLSIYCRTAFAGASVAAMWGVVGPAGGTGSVWMMTTKTIESIPFSFVREARREVSKMLSFYPQLIGAVSADYPEALRLLESLGFKIEDGPGPVLFYSMEA